VVISLIVVVVGVLVLSGVYLSRYQPLSANGTGTTWVDPRYATHLGDFNPPGGESFSAYRVRYADGRLFRYALTLHNEGPLPVTITGVGEDNCGDCTIPLVFERSSVTPPTGRYQFDSEHAAPFDGFVLQPGAYRSVVIEERFDHCESYATGSGVTFQSIAVGYRTAFFHHEVRLPMPYTFEVRFRGPECPGGLQSAA
jgi:hypothetical protein